MARPDQGSGLGYIGGGFRPRGTLATLSLARAPLWFFPIVLAWDSAVAVLALFASELASLVWGALSAAGCRGETSTGRRTTRRHGSYGREGKIVYVCERDRR